MKKKLKNKILAALLTISLIAGNVSGLPSSASAQSDSGAYTNYATDELVADFNFGTDVTADTLYSQETGYGFSDVEYSIPATGWVNGVYYPRVPVNSISAVNVKTVSGSALTADPVTESASSVEVVSGSALNANALEISSKVWTETESSGYGVYSYENTSIFNVDLANADYNVTVTLVNPTNTEYTAYLEAENITKATDIKVAPGASVPVTITSILVDGQLNLKFLAPSTATQDSLAVEGKVYVSHVLILRQKTNEAVNKPTVFIASDSTVQTYDSFYYPQTGWGQTLHNFFGAFVAERENENCNYSQAQTYETENVIIENRAIGGRSSKSFIEEGKLDDLLEDVKPGDYILIQWGHNDATYSRPNRYVSAADFPQILQYYIDGCKQRGATPVLVTPVSRYSVRTDGTFNSDFETYRQAMITLGAQQNVPVLDLTGASIDLCNTFGAEGAKSLFLHVAAGEYTGSYAGGITDNTHLQYYGAYKFAQCVAKLIQAYTLDGQLDSLKALVELNAPTTAPAAVSNVVTTSVGATSISFTWDNADGAELYYIYRAELAADQTTDSIDFSSTVKYSVSATNKFTDKNCDGGKTYVYAVRAFNEFGLGEFSQKFSVTTKSSLYKYDFDNAATDPVMPGWIQVINNQMYSDTLGYGWTKAPNNGRNRGTSPYADANDMTIDFCMAGDFAVKLPNGDYEVKFYSGDLISGGSTIKSDFFAEGAAIGNISAKQAVGTLSATVRVVDGQLNITVGGQNGYINGMEITPLLLAPSNLSYSELEFTETNAQFLINFDGITEAVSYNIYQKSSTDTTFSLFKSIAAADKDSLDARAMVANIGETREYYVTAVTADGRETAPSSSIAIEMVDPNALPPAAPQNLVCTLAAEANIVIAWDAVEGAITYNVYRSTRPEGAKGYTGYQKVGETSVPYFNDTDSDIDTNINYYYRVEAVGKGGVGEKSGILITPITETLIRQDAEQFSNRALVAVDLAGNKGAEINVTTKDSAGNELTSGVYLSWRLFESDPEDVTFTVYRNDVAIATNLKVTNCVDPDGSAGDVYKVVGSSDSTVGVNAIATSTWENYFIELQLQKPVDQMMPDGTTCTYTANDMSVGDLDNDGSYELIVKWTPSNSKDNSGGGYTGTTILDAYDFNSATGAATLMWRIDLGVNIRSGAHYTQFQVWDFDGDGSAELMCKTADGSTTYQNFNGNLVETGHVGACSASALPTSIVSASNDYRNTSGYILSGPEYLTIFDGETGNIIDSTDYVPARGSVDAWGDGYGNRVDRFLSAVAYLDGEKASAIFARGYYTRTCLTAYDFVDTNSDGVGDELQKRWAFDTNNYPKAEYGELEAQGNHGLSINDIDADGKDEIIYGALIVDHNGTFKYTTGLGHGDAMHVSDWIPSRPGLEIFSVHEHSNAAYQVEIHDAETGEVIWGYFTGVDTGRGVAADVDPNHLGGEMWANAAWDGTDGGLYSSLSTLINPIKIANRTPDVNFTLFWDGDLLSELQNHTFNNSAYVPISTNITKWNYMTQMPEKIFESTEIYTSNGTKGNLGLVADILGDWREEMIARTSADNSKIRIYTSTIITDYTIPTLMENDAYRIGIAWQNVGYNQPANLDYLLSEGVITSSLKAGPITQSTANILFTDASDGKYGHDITGYEVYRAAEGDYTLIDTLELDELVIVTEDGEPVVEPVQPVEYKFDFGSSVLQDGWIQINAASDTYETSGIYGFTNASKALGYSDKAYAGATTNDLASVYNDSILGWNDTTAYEFNVNVPNGTYEVTYYAYNGSGEQYNLVTVEGTAMPDIRRGKTSPSAISNTVTVEVTDGTINVTNKSSKVGYKGIYFNGLTVKQIIEEVPVVVDPTVTTYYGYKDTTVQSDTAYTYKVAAIVDGKTSFMSAPLEVKTLVDITSIPEFEIADLVEDAQLPEGGTVASLLPPNVKVIDSNNNETFADVVWDVSALNLAEPGEYTVVATIAGYLETITKTVNVIPNTITSYEFMGYTKTSDVEPYYTNYAVQNALALELPATVVFYYLNGRAEEVTVTWDLSTVDLTTKGTYVIAGTTNALTASEGKFGTQTVKLNVEVKDDYIIGFTEIPGVEAVIGSTVDELADILPTTLTANYKSGKTGTVTVNWNTNIDDSLLEAVGNIDISGTVENYSGQVLIKVSVDYEALWKFDFGINASEEAAGWTGVTVNPKGGKKTTTDLGIAYNEEKGYGFSNALAVIEGRSEGYTQNGILPYQVYKDFVIPDGQTFLIDVPNGTYSIEYTSGSAYKSSVKVTVEDLTNVYSASNAANSYVIGKISDIKISDGQISLKFPSGNTSRLNSIVIRQLSVDETPTGQPTPTPEVSVTPTPEATATPTPEATATPTPEATVTPTPEATATPEATVTPTPEATATPTPEATVTPTPVATITPTPVATPTPGLTPTPTPVTIPHIDGVESAKGWAGIINYLNEIKEEVQDKDKVVIQAGVNTILPKDAILAIQGKDITVELQFEGYSWLIQGQDIVGEELEDIDLSITKTEETIPDTLLDDLAGKNPVIPLQLAHNGEFGLRATLSIDVNMTNEGKIANLFYYNPITGTLQLQSVDIVDGNGKVDLNFTHASEYIIVLDDTVLLENEVENIEVVPETDKLYIGGNTGKTTMIRVLLPGAINEAIELGLAEAIITYETDNKKVVTAAKNGKLTAKAEGTATITTTVTIGDITKTFTNTITVKKAYIEVIEATDTMKVGDEFTFTVKVYGYKEVKVTFTSTKKSIIVIDKTTGKAEAVSKGTDYIVVKCGKLSMKLKVTVK